MDDSLVIEPNDKADIMENIHKTCVMYGSSKDSSYIDYVKGTNVGGFLKVAQSMLEQGIV